MKNIGKINGVMGQLWFIQIRMNLPRTPHNGQHSTDVRTLTLPLG